MTKHTVDEAIGGFEPKTDNSVIELGLGEDHPRFNYGESCAATALRDVNALKEAQHMLNCGIYGDGTADPLSPAFRINIIVAGRKTSLCDFCGKTEHEVDVLVFSATAEVAICDVCALTSGNEVMTYLASQKTEEGIHGKEETP